MFLSDYFPKNVIFVAGRSFDKKSECIFTHKFNVNEEEIERGHSNRHFFGKGRTKNPKNIKMTTLATLI